MYKAGEYMIWSDGNTYLCVQDTNFSPDEYPQAWQLVTDNEYSSATENQEEHYE